MRLIFNAEAQREEKQKHVGPERWVLAATLSAERVGVFFLMVTQGCSAWGGATLGFVTQPRWGCVGGWKNIDHVCNRERWFVERVIT